ERCERRGGVFLHSPRTRSYCRSGIAGPNGRVRWSSRPGATPSSARRLKLPCPNNQRRALQACWPSTASTLLLWARQHATRKNVERSRPASEDSKRTDLGGVAEDDGRRWEFKRHDWPCMA